MNRIISESKLVQSGHRENITVGDCIVDDIKNENKDSLIGPDPGFITIGPPGSGADHEVARTTDDIGAVINTLIASDVVVYIMKGKYTCKTRIEIADVSFFKLYGAGKDNTVIFTDPGVSFCYLSSVANRFKCGILNMTISHGDVNGSGTNVGNAGTVGIQIESCKSCTFVDLNVSWFETGLYFENDVFYTAVNRVEVQNSSLYSCRISYGNADRCNENCFVDCVFLGATAPGSNQSTAPDVHLKFDRGNNNKFYGCVFENWKNYAVEFASDNLAETNFICGARMESNGWNVGTGPAIKFGDLSQRNYILQPYIGGDDTGTDTWVDYGTSAGNWIESTNYKGSTIRKERSLLTAGDFITYIRSGSGDGKSLLTLRDTYNNSGDPDGTLKIDVYRPTGKALKIEQDSKQELYNITGEGVQNFKGYVDLGAPKSSFRMFNISPQLDGPNLLDAISYVEFDAPNLLNGATVTEGHALTFDAGPGIHPCLDNGTVKPSIGIPTTWLKCNINGNNNYIPMYSDKTT